MFRNLRILGLRGFSVEQRIDFALPSGAPGSGLTVLVGANNAGKSTIIEALRALSQRQPTSFSEGRRNSAAGDRVVLSVTTESDQLIRLSTKAAGGSETEWDNYTKQAFNRLFVLPSRRVFSPYFGKGSVTRENYMNSLGFPPERSSTVQQFTARLFAIQDNQKAFNEVLQRVVSPVPAWTIDMADTGAYFLKFNSGAGAHSSEGMGEGLVSLMYIVDALYDSEDGDTIVIDEPELSLHPTFQRKLSTLLLDYASTRQIVVATHSPYFAGINSLAVGTAVARVFRDSEGSKVAQLTNKTGRALGVLLGNQNNPHILGLNAQEVLFAEDGVVLVEGQEDVMFYPAVLDDLNIPVNGTFFGWGVGGADNMERIAKALHELGYQKVVGILDANKLGVRDSLRESFPQFCFEAIPADDVRSKAEVQGRAAVKGLLDENNCKVRDEFKAETDRLFRRVAKYLGR